MLDESCNNSSATKETGSSAIQFFIEIDRFWLKISVVRLFFSLYLTETSSQYLYYTVYRGRRVACIRYPTGTDTHQIF